MPTRTLTLLVASLLAGCSLAGAQGLDVNEPGMPMRVYVDGELIDGQDFAGLRLNAPPRDAALDFTAQRARAWTVGETTRLLLERDVRIGVGISTFQARRALVWMQPIFVNTEGGESVRAQQVAIYFDTIRTPEAAPGGLIQDAERLLVTAILRTPPVELGVDTLVEGRPTPDEADLSFVVEGEDRLARLLAEQAGVEPAPYPELVERIAVPDRAPLATGPLPYEQLFPDQRGPLEPADRAPIQYTEQGAFSAFAPQVETVVLPSGEEAAVLLGGVSVQYQPLNESGPGSPLELTADHAVLFFEPGSQTPSRAGTVSDVAGIYLEGDVLASNGEYSLRGSRVFYDPKTDRAVALDAVFWTYDEERGLPLYLRADAIRQLSLEQWSAESATLANVSFAQPHFSIGASQATVSIVEPELAGQPDRLFVDADNVGFRVGSATVARVPAVRGEIQQSILKEVSYGSRLGNNVVSTVLDLYPLFGLEPAAGSSAELTVDAFIERGLGLGSEFSWDNPRFVGNLAGYFIYDDGEDRFSTGEEIERDTVGRGNILGENIWFFSEKWSIFSEFSFISDEAFIEAFYPDDAETRREYVSSINLRYLDEQQMFSARGRGTLNDFIPNEYLLQSLGYSTQKLPELRYDLVGKDFWELVNYTGHIQVSRMALRFHERTPRQLGFFDPRLAVESFGVGPDTTIASRLQAAGFTEQELLRLDTRHEVEMPLRAGPLNIVPFASGRLTLYDQDVQDFGGFPEEDNRARVWFAAGVRLHTALVRTIDAIRSDLLNVNRLRHIVEPSLTLFAAGSNLTPQDLPVYDDSVESIETGTVIRAGVRNTFQTKRGEPGRERSVDWLVFDVNIVNTSAEVDRESPFSFFDEARPERSQLGEFVRFDGLMQVTDSLAIVSSLDYDLDASAAAKTTLGARLDHGHGFSSFFEWRDLDAIGSRRLIGGASYELSRKYSVALAAAYSLESERVDGVSAQLVRRFPQWTLQFGINVDNVSDRVSAGVALRPVGVGSETRRRAFTEDGPIYSSTPTIRALQPEPFASGPFRRR